MRFFIITVLFLFYCNIVNAKEYSVVSSKNMPMMTINELRALYLKKIIFLKDVKVIPLNLSANSKIRRSFEKNILHMSENQLKRYWIKEHYLGKRPPIMLESQRAVQKFVHRVNGAIGYIENTQNIKMFKVLYQWKDEE